MEKSIVISPLDRMVGALPPPDVRCCFNCTKWHKKRYIHCQCSGPWGGDIFGDKNCVFRAKKVRSNVKAEAHTQSDRQVEKTKVKEK